MNGDGYSDVVVGAYGNDAGGTDAGAAYLYDFNRYFVTSPNGGETWTRNAGEVVSWLGAEPADVWLTVDDGAFTELLAAGVGGVESNAAEVTAPNIVTDLAQVRIVPHEVWITGSDLSDSVFTIQATTGVEPGDATLRFRAPWPNPSSGVVRFGIELARPGVVTVHVLDVAGREVARPIAAERFEAGKVTREWRPDGLAPGRLHGARGGGRAEAHAPAGLAGREVDAQRREEGAGSTRGRPPRFRRSSPLRGPDHDCAHKVRGINPPACGLVSP